MKKILISLGLVMTLLVPTLALAQMGNVDMETPGLEVNPDKSTPKGFEDIEETTPDPIPEAKVKTPDLTLTKEDKNLKKYEQVQKTDDEINQQCGFTAGVLSKLPCISNEEDGQYIYIVLDETLDTVDAEQYSEDGSIVRACQRMVQIENCQVKTNSEPIIVSKTRYVKENKCTPKGSKANMENGRTYCEDVTVIMSPISSGGSGLLNTYIGLIYRWAAGIVGIIAVLVIIMNSVLIISSQGEQGTIDGAKTRIFQSLGGIAILFLSALVLYTINPNFFKL